VQQQPPLGGNPHAESSQVSTLPPVVEEVLLQRTIYVKKLIEECNNSDDTAKLLKVTLSLHSLPQISVFNSFNTGEFFLLLPTEPGHLQGLQQKKIH
jgi:hypothetical protein